MSRLYIVMYHYTRDLTHSRYPDIKGLDIPAFKKQIEFLIENFNVIRMEDLLESMDSSKQLPENACLLTFDDGYIDNFTYAFPILESLGLQGSFFIPGKTFSEHKLLDVNKIHYILASVDNPKCLLKDVRERMDYYRGKEYVYPSTEELYEEYAIANRFDPAEVIFIKRVLQTLLPEKVRNAISSDLFKKYVGVSEEQLAYELYMTYEQILTLKRHGMFIGLHGYDHYWLGNMQKEEMQTDIDKAIDVLGSLLGDKWVMNYPYGNSSDEVIDYIKRKNCALGLTTKVAVADTLVDDRYLLPRLDCNDFPPKTENYLNYE